MEDAPSPKELVGTLPLFFYDAVGRILPGAIAVLGTLTYLNRGRLNSWTELIAAVQAVFPKESTAGYSLAIVLVFFGFSYFAGISLASLAHDLVERPWNSIAKLDINGAAHFLSMSGPHELQARFKECFGQDIRDLGQSSFLCSHYAWRINSNLGILTSRWDAEALCARSLVLIGLVFSLTPLAFEHSPWTTFDWAWTISWLVLFLSHCLSFNYHRKKRLFGRDSMPEGVVPTYIAVDVPGLTEQLFDEPEGVRIVRRIAEDNVALEKNEVDNILALLDRTLTVRRARGELRIVDPQENPIGILNIGKTRISFRRFEIREIENIYVEPINPPGGKDDSGVPIRRYIDRNDLFTILFSDLSIVYLDGALYRDPSLGDGTHFLSYVQTDQRLNDATSEKGTFTAMHTEFDRDSVFGVVASRIAAQDEILICDDLGDEWADFIGINTRNQPKTISFYHAKHDDLTLGASVLHAAVGQALKNLGRMNLTVEEIDAKLPGWGTVYVNDNVETQIQRIIRGDGGAIRETIAAALSSPDTIRRVFIVTSSLSRRQVEGRFVAIRDGQAPRPHFVQLYWLLMSFFSDCTEVGAYPYVVCQE